MDEINVQIRFSRQTEYGEYSDSLYMPLAQYLALSTAEVDALVDARVDAWRQGVAAAAAVTEPPAEVVIDGDEIPA